MRRNRRILLVAFLSGAGISILSIGFFGEFRRDSQFAQVTSPALEPIPEIAPSPHVLDYCEKLYTTICERTGVVMDPTGSVRRDSTAELRVLRTYEDIIRKHPDWTVEQVDEELVKTIYTPKRRQVLEGTFQWVKGSKAH